MFSLRFVSDYLLHRFSAKNRHGLHSPFVYRLTDEVIYDYSAKKTYPKGDRGPVETKVNRLIYRLIADWQPRNIALFGTVPVATLNYVNAAAPNAETYIDEENEGNRCGTYKLDVALIGTAMPAQTLKYFDWCVTNAHDHTMLIFTGIYHNKELCQVWHEIKNRPEVTVTIDLFWIGLVFFRKGQAKEDFKIRV